MKTREKSRIDQLDSSIERLHSIISDKDKEISKLTHNVTKEKSLPVFNMNVNESHSSLKLYNHCDVDQLDPGESFPIVEDARNSIAVPEGKVKTKRKRKKNRNL